MLNAKSHILGNLHAAATDPRHAEIRESIDACDLSAFEDEHSVCIAKEESFICEICDQMAYLLGCHEPLALHPVLKYSPESDDWADMGNEEKTMPHLMDMKPYEHLMTTLLKLQDTLIQIVRSNSVIILSNIRFDIREIGEEDFDPESFVPQIKKLSAEDYDPIFGQSPEELLSVFSEAVARLSGFVNSLPDYQDWMALCPEENSQLLNRRLDMYKMGCLQQYLSDWQDALEREMDRAYQEQRADTVQVYERLKQIVDELL